MLALVDDFHVNADKGQATFLLLLGLFAMFDALNHAILWEAWRQKYASGVLTLYQ